MNIDTPQTADAENTDLITVTVFTDKLAKVKKEGAVSWDALRDAVLQKTAPTKGALPWLKLARFGNNKTTSGSLRHDANVLAITGIEADYDGGEVSVDGAVELLTKAGIKAMVYTSPSHTAEKPRWRVLCPVSVELPPDQRESLMARLNGALGGILAGESFTLSQAYYYGSVGKNPDHRAVMVAGQPIDLLTDLDAGAIGRPATKAEVSKGAVTKVPVARAQNDTAALLKEITSGAGYHGATVTLAGRMAKADVPRTVAKRQITDAFDAAQEDQKNERWKQRRADVSRCVDDIYAKEALDAEGERVDAPEERTSPQERIVDAVLAAGVTFWRDADGRVYARVPMGNGVVNLDVRSGKFEAVCRSLYGKAFPVMGAQGLRPAAVSDNAVKTAIGAFTAMGLEAKDVLTPGVRLVGHEGAIWIDLGDETYRAIRVAADGWAVEPIMTAPLVRKNGMRALPVPVRAEGSLERLRGMLNITSDDDFRLACAWLVAALRPTGPYMVLAVDGQHGSGKSTTSRMLRRLVDPNAGDARGVSKGEDDLLLAALNGSVVVVDNLSSISAEMSDKLCCVATGAGWGKRTLYSDLDETIISVCRPILLNGIGKVATMRGDLADRSITLTLPAIPEEKRREEAEVWAEFDAAAPGVLALLLDGLVTGLQNLPNVKLERLPRMADFAKLACASAPAFGWTQEEMFAAIEGNRQKGSEAVIEGDAIALALLEIADEQPDGWTGTATQLLREIEDKAFEGAPRERDWPKTASRLSTRMTRVKPALEAVGVLAELTREGGTGKKIWRIAKAA